MNHIFSKMKLYISIHTINHKFSISIHKMDHKIFKKKGKKAKPPAGSAAAISPAAAAQAAVRPALPLLLRTTQPHTTRDKERKEIRRKERDKD
jgi:hypothetical protein